MLRSNDLDIHQKPPAKVTRNLPRVSSWVRSFHQLNQRWAHCAWTCSNSSVTPSTKFIATSDILVMTFAQTAVPQYWTDDCRCQHGRFSIPHATLYASQIWCCTNCSLCLTTTSLELLRYLYQILSLFRCNPYLELSITSWIRDSHLMI